MFKRLFQRIISLFRRSAPVVVEPSSTPDAEPPVSPCNVTPDQVHYEGSSADDIDVGESQACSEPEPVMSKPVRVRELTPRRCQPHNLPNDRMIVLDPPEDPYALTELELYDLLGNDPTAYIPHDSYEGRWA